MKHAVHAFSIGVLLLFLTAGAARVISWGEKGFAWIKYGSNNIGMFAAWIDTDMRAFSPPPGN